MIVTPKIEHTRFAPCGLSGVIPALATRTSRTVDFSTPDRPLRVISRSIYDTQPGGCKYSCRYIWYLHTKMVEGAGKTDRENLPPPKWPRRAGEESAAVGVAFLKKTFDVGAIPGRITGAGVFHKLLDLGIEVFLAFTSLGHVIDRHPSQVTCHSADLLH